MSGQFSAQAQDQALGYLYQVRYALLLLIKAGIEDPEAQISIECLDDIAFEKNGTPVELIQTKHHRNRASLSDSSTDLWKTLRVWCEAFLQGKLQTENVIFTIITTEQAAVDSAASKLRPPVWGSRNVNEALEALINIAQTSGNKTNEAAYQTFLRLSKDQQRVLLANVQIIDDSPNIITVKTEITNHLRYTTRPKFLSPVCERLEGWWFEIVVKHLSSKSSDVISHGDLQNKLNDIQEQFYDDNLPIDYPVPISIEEKEAEEDKRIFVEQLRLVKGHKLRVQKAISDFYRSSAQRSQWIRDGILLNSELEQYEARLCDEWERRYAVMQENLTDNPTEESMQKEGRELFNEIEKATMYIRSRCTAEYIMRGSYHILADQLHVGWHVEFRIRLNHLRH